MKNNPLIQNATIAVWPDDEGGWFASADGGRGEDYHGPTPIIAARRCRDASIETNTLKETTE